MNAPIDPRVLPGEDLLRWFKPETPMEEALAGALLEARDQLGEKEEQAELIVELEEDITDLKNERDELEAELETAHGEIEALQDRITVLELSHD